MAEAQDCEIIFPKTLRFSDLGLDLLPNGGFVFNWAVLLEVYKASKFPNEQIMRRSITTAIQVILAWYQHHLQQGGAPDPIMDGVLQVEAPALKPWPRTLHQPGHA